MNYTDTTVLTFLPLLACLALVAGTIVLIVLLVRRSGRKSDERLAAQWKQARADVALGRGHLAYVEHVYQRARRGSKAVLQWDGVTWRQDAWFWHWHAPQGWWVLIQGSRGWGPHNRNPNVFYIERHQVLATIPGGAKAAFERQRAGMDPTI